MKNQDVKTQVKPAPKPVCKCGATKNLTKIGDLVRCPECLREAVGTSGEDML